MKKGFEIAINFLLYSYFGVTIDSSIDEIIDASIKKAYSDATNQGAFNALKKMVNDKELDDKTKSITYDKAQNCIKAMADKFLTEPYRDDFNDAHKKVCNELIEIYQDITVDKDNKEIKAFSYGNAQKWVNMTMKYLYVICNILEKVNELTSEKRKFVKNVLNTSKYFHIPIDSYILEYLWRYDNNFIKNIPGTEPLKSGSYGVFNNEKVKSWSSWKESEYIKFRDDLTNLEEPFTIEKEGPAWIEIAEKRKGKNSKK